MTTSSFFPLPMLRFGLNFHCIGVHVLVLVELHNLEWLTEHSSKKNLSGVG